MASWTPDATVLGQVAHMLTCSLAPDNKLQREAREAMAANSAHPDFPRYLLVIFSCGSQFGLSVGVRHSAGVQLKIFVDKGFDKLAGEVQELFKAGVTPCLADDAPQLRLTAANVIATIVRDADLVSWPALPAALHGAMVSGKAEALLGALQCLQFLSDDVAVQFDAKVLGHPLNVIIPTLIECLRHPAQPVRLLAARCMNNFLFCRSAALIPHVQPYLQALAALTADPSADVRELVCTSFATLAETNIALIWPQAGPIMEYVLACLGAPEPGLNIAACQFWDTIIDVIRDDEHSAVISAAFIGLLPRLIPQLLSKMVISEEDYAHLVSLESERAEDVRPHIYKSRPMAVAGGGDVASASGGTAAGESL